jgi:hypothetical protein
MPKPICVPCKRYYKIVKTGFAFTEGFAPNCLEPDNWKPYKIWFGDLWRCCGCDHRMITGFGAAPISEHYKPDFAAKMLRFRADQFQVNDC